MRSSSHSLPPLILLQHSESTQEIRKHLVHQAEVVLWMPIHLPMSLLKVATTRHEEKEEDTFCFAVFSIVVSCKWLHGGPFESELSWLMWWVSDWCCCDWRWRSLRDASKMKGRKEVSIVMKEGGMTCTVTYITTLLRRGMRRRLALRTHGECQEHQLNFVRFIASTSFLLYIYIQMRYTILFSVCT